MTVDIGRLGDAVRQRRAELGVSQVELWKAGGPSNSTLTNIESGRDVPVHPKTLRKLDFALGLPTGRAYRVLHGDGDSAEQTAVSVSGDDRHPPDGAAPIRLGEPVIAALRHDAEQARRALVRYSNRQLDLEALAARLYRLIDTAELAAEQAHRGGVV